VHVLKQHHLKLPEAADLAQNCPLWRMMSMYGAKQLYFVYDIIIIMSWL